MLYFLMVGFCCGYYDIAFDLGSSLLFLRSTSVAIFLRPMTGQWIHFHTLQQKLSLCGAINVPLTLHSTQPFPSSP